MTYSRIKINVLFWNNFGWQALTQITATKWRDCVFCLPLGKQMCTHSPLMHGTRYFRGYGKATLLQLLLGSIPRGAHKLRQPKAEPGLPSKPDLGSKALGVQAWPWSYFCTPGNHSLSASPPLPNTGLPTRTMLPHHHRNKARTR